MFLCVILPIICIKSNNPIINESNIIILRTRLKQGNSVITRNIITRNISNILFYLLKKFFINNKFVNIP